MKQHIFFKNINWDTLARQKVILLIMTCYLINNPVSFTSGWISSPMLPLLQAAFVPSSDNALDTSYFSSRYSWNPSDENIYEASEFEDSSDNRSLDGSSSCVSNHHDEQVWTANWSCLQFYFFLPVIDKFIQACLEGFKCELVYNWCDGYINLKINFLTMHINMHLQAQYSFGT